MSGRVVVLPGTVSAAVEGFAYDAVRAAVSAPGDIRAIEVLRVRSSLFSQAQFDLPLVDEVTALRYAVKSLLNRPSSLTRRAQVLLSAGEVLDGFAIRDDVTVASLLSDGAARFADFEVAS